jgi:hypothetical protein
MPGSRPDTNSVDTTDISPRSSQAEQRSRSPRRSPGPVAMMGFEKRVEGLNSPSKIIRHDLGGAARLVALVAHLTALALAFILALILSFFLARLWCRTVIGSLRALISLFTRLIRLAANVLRLTTHGSPSRI